MKSIKLALIGLLLVAGSSFSLRAADLHFIMCGVKLERQIKLL